MPAIDQWIALGGWHDNPREVQNVLSTLPYPVMGPASYMIKGSGKGVVALLYKHVEKLLGSYNVRRQEIGDCVSFGAACAVDAVKATEIVAGGQRGEWVAETATEPIYASSRVEIGGGRLGNSDGSMGAWAAKAVQQYGTLVRKSYSTGSNTYDLTKYSGQRAKQWGAANAGLPNDLEPMSKEHPIRTVSLVTTWEECRDAIANGYAVTIASNAGFTSTRDLDGFASPSGSWAHQMCVIAVDDEFRRPGALIQNSWGPTWISGPKRHDQPDGSFWVDAEVLERNILKQQDSWAFSDYEGYPPKNINWRIV